MPRETVTELQEKRGTLVAQARERLDLIEDNTPEERVAELETQHDTAMAELDKLDARIEREIKFEEVEKRENERREEAKRAKKRPIPADTDENREDETDTVEYRVAFAKYICGMSQENMTPEERAILRENSTEFRAQTAGTTTAGGFTVPETLADEIIKSLLAWGPMYDPGVTREMVTSSGNTIKVPTVDDTGVDAEDHTEATALTDDGGKDVTFGQKTLDAYAFDTEFVKWSWELDTDSIFAMETLLGDLLGERLGRKANAQLTVGTGSSAPNGIVTASSLGVTLAAQAITTNEIIDLEHSVNRAYRRSPKAAFMFNDSLLKAIRKLKDSNGAYVWSAGDIKQGVPGTLSGRNYHINDDMVDFSAASPPAASKVMLFGDLNKYFVRKVGQPVIGVMRERFWPDLGIAGLIRFDGELGDTAAVKHMITP